jgi:hypothetical protein
MCESKVLRVYNCSLCRSIPLVVVNMQARCGEIYLPRTEHNSNLFLFFLLSLGFTHTPPTVTE